MKNDDSATVDLELLVVKDEDNRLRLLAEEEGRYVSSRFSEPYNPLELRGIIANALEENVRLTYQPKNPLPAGLHEINIRDIGEIEGKPVPVLVMKDADGKFYALLKGRENYFVEEGPLEPYDAAQRFSQTSKRRETMMYAPNGLPTPPGLQVISAEDRNFLSSD